MRTIRESLAARRERLYESDGPEFIDKWKYTPHSRVKVDYTNGQTGERKRVVWRFAATNLADRGPPKWVHHNPVEIVDRAKSEYAKRGHTVHSAEFESNYDPPKREDPTKGRIEMSNQAQRINRYLTQKTIGPRR